MMVSGIAASLRLTTQDLESDGKSNTPDAVFGAVFKKNFQERTATYCDMQDNSSRLQPDITTRRTEFRTYRRNTPAAMEVRRHVTCGYRLLR